MAFMFEKNFGVLLVESCWENTTGLSARTGGYLYQIVCKSTKILPQRNLAIWWDKRKEFVIFVHPLV